jgi:hypothetical protein
MQGSGWFQGGIGQLGNLGAQTGEEGVGAEGIGGEVAEQALKSETAKTGQDEQPWFSSYWSSATFVRR